MLHPLEIKRGTFTKTISEFLDRYRISHELIEEKEKVIIFFSEKPRLETRFPLPSKKVELARFYLDKGRRVSLVVDTENRSVSVYDNEGNLIDKDYYVEPEVEKKDKSIHSVCKKAAELSPSASVQNEAQKTEESDPNGLDAHEPGSKLDAGKPRPSLILGDMAPALLAVISVADYGAGKYTEGGWLEVPDGEKRYTDAMLRHYLAEQFEDFDKDSELLHAAHLAWNALARLKFILDRTALIEEKK
jgi:hypothetical protein